MFEELDHIASVAAMAHALGQIARDLDDTTRIDLLRELDDLKSAAAAAQARITADLDARRCPGHARP